MKFRAIKLIYPNDISENALRLTLALEIEPHRDGEYQDLEVTVEKPGADLLSLSLREVQDLAVERAREIVGQMERALKTADSA